ncbi:OsmC family protein [Flavitalea sp.]|nr:OsmC family protein [Flavitalea sp.]
MHHYFPKLCIVICRSCALLFAEIEYCYFPKLCTRSCRFLCIVNCQSQDIGPDPFTAVLSGLVGCTLTTLRMYINRKGWDIKDIHCSVNMLQEIEPFKTSIFRTVSFGQPVTDEQKERLLWVAKNCPVAKLLQGEIVIDTHLSDDAAVPAGT